MKTPYTPEQLEADRRRRPRKTNIRRWTGLSLKALGWPEYFRQWKQKRRVERGLNQNGEKIGAAMTTNAPLEPSGANDARKTK